jgi:carnitine O-acetyltransferase
MLRAAASRLSPRLPAPMLRFQSSLPALPVPSLQHTCAKYLDSLKPLLALDAYARTQKIVDSFLASPQAAQLQTRLQDRAAQPGMDSWLADWWNDAAYMGYRDPVVVFVSYFFVHIQDKLCRGQAKRASHLVKAMLPFRELVERCVVLCSNFM